MEKPLVTVICLCYNHARFINQAIKSVLSQTHDNVQLIVVDDASTDGSVDLIRETLVNYPDVPFLNLEKNLGNCRAFNKGFEFAKGEFVIDLAADDQLEPKRIEAGLQAFAFAGTKFGVNFCDALILTEEGKPQGLHSDRFPHDMVPQGNVYEAVIRRYFINSPTMMIRREVLEQLGGYDETLAFEDFDFWVRSSRDWSYCYTALPLVRRRLVGTSMARQQYKRNSPQLLSTFRVCEKIRKLNRHVTEDSALRKRVLYEMRRAFAVGELGITLRYIGLFFRIGR